MDQFFQQLVNGLTLGSLYALIAVGYTVVYGIVQLINFAHGEVFMIGAFGALTTYLLFFDGKTSVWILPIMIVGAMIASVGTAVLMERVAYRPLRNAPRLAPLITAIGISVFLQEFIRLFYEEPGWTVVVFAGLAIAVGYVAGGRVAKVDLNHPVSRWYDRAPLLGGAGGAVALWIVVRLAQPRPQPAADRRRDRARRAGRHRHRLAGRSGGAAERPCRGPGSGDRCGRCRRRASWPRSAGCSSRS